MLPRAGRRASEQEASARNAQCCEHGAVRRSRRDIAESLGLTIETVSRQLSLLREAGVIETTGRSGIVLREMEMLKARAGYLRDAA